MKLDRIRNYLRIFYHWKVRNALALPYVPEDISIEATNVCNFRCSFCPQSDPRHHELVPRTYLDPQRARRIFETLRQGGVTTRTVHWTLDGEPFMNKQFYGLCEIAVEYGFTNMHFATNGMLLSDRSIRQLPAGENVRYTFSIDYAADREYFERVRGTEGSWSKIKENIEAILAQNRNDIFVKITDISTYEVDDPAMLERRFEELKALFPSDSGRLSFARRTFHNAAGLVSKLVNAMPGKKYHLCPYPWTSLVIASNGDAVACCRDLRRQTVLGNVVEQGLAVVWNGQPYQELRRALVEKRPGDIAACDGCDLPYDSTKFSYANIYRTLTNRLQVFR
jgi:radical SAM protein with 4Fe4S-binding SPASM domain